jgi:FAD/FMN-containing dehydrogenase/Fe-S oxidoreductase
MALIDQLRRELRGEVRDDAYSRHLFSTDASMYAIEPVAVVFPRDADDVAAAISAAARHGVPVIARGAGTSLGGQAVGRGIVLDTSRHMDAILAIDGDSARVQAGVVQDDLNRAAGAHGLVFGPDTSTSDRATLGGMIGSNSAGAHSVLYGSTIDHVLELEVVLADGSRARFGPIDDTVRAQRAARDTLDGAIHRELPRIVTAHREAIARDWPPHPRLAGGYRLDRLAEAFDLARFVVGSEGTLVAITEATVSLAPLPTARMFAVGHFDSVKAAVAATGDGLALGAAAVELIDRTIIEYGGLDVDAEALLYVTFFGDDARERITQLEARWRGIEVTRAETAAEQARLTRVRKAGLGHLMAASRGMERPQAFVEDTAVAPEKLDEHLARFQEILDRHGLRAGLYGHASVGCIHVRPYLDLTAPDGVATLKAVAEEVVAQVRELGGVISSEHGDGRVRSPFNRAVFGDELYGAFGQVKRLFDPQGILNPGVMVDAEPLDAHLRDPALPAPRPLPTRFTFDGGMRAAADRCQRIGACRKSASGTMCPSYMATREEEHATRGRANALVRALSQPDPQKALGDERLHEILDLCLECKACKHECPLSVDMATLKSEFLAHYQDIHGVPLRSRAFAAIRTLNRLGAATAPVSNWAAPLVRKPLKLSPRPLPRFARPHKHGAKTGDVVLLADSFTTYSDPDITRAAIALLEASGHRVRLESGGCCGRASISKGRLDQARDQAERMVARLAPEAERGVPIAGVEPSCLLTLREEFLSLLPGDPRAQAVARQARLIEEVLGELPVKHPPRRILFHGHCHQKALAGTAATLRLLRSTGAEVVELDAGCCGMAGSFGFEAEHYELSMKIGEDRRFPAVRAEPPDTVIAATGVSCRQQIAHGTGRIARHPVQIVRDAM